MSPKDSKIIKSNPNVTPYDLLMNHGLSQGGFEEMNAIADQATDNMLKAGKPRLVPSISKSLPTMPHTMPHLQVSEKVQVTLRAKNSGSHGTLMDKLQAEKMVNKYPHQYEIV